MSQDDTSVLGHPGSGPIRATMNYRIEHSLDVSVTEPKSSVLEAEGTGYAAHSRFEAGGNPA